MTSLCQRCERMRLQLQRTAKSPPAGPPVAGPTLVTYRPWNFSEFCDLAGSQRLLVAGNELCGRRSRSRIECNGTAGVATGLDPAPRVPALLARGGRELPAKECDSNERRVYFQFANLGS